ncbi:unnamed protein product [Ambrosiozyma monospora]|uniref:Unnamed protein product n=1 Tax=Ambrosiozyma monospora TaxID=43982 RepID=A0A9W7DIE4_AMBMO|nr:unnamed protein product [Ambrosiozyma monospora]
MSKSVLNLNILNENNAFLRQHSNSYKILHIYKFDESLYRTFLPNPAYFGEKAIKHLLPGNAIIFPELNWYTSPLPFASTALDDPGNWNPNVIKLINFSKDDPDVLIMVFVNRNEDIFRKLVIDLIGNNRDLAGVVDVLLMNENESVLPSYISLLTEAFQNITKVVYYSSNDQDTFKTKLLKNRVEVDEFQVVKQYRHMDPEIEIPLVSSLVQSYNQPKLVHNKMKAPSVTKKLSRSVKGSYYRLPLEEIQKLHKAIIPFICQHDYQFLQMIDLAEEGQFTFKDSTGVPIIAQNTLSGKNSSELGGIGKRILMGVVSMGYIKGKIYAVKLIANHEPVQCYLAHPKHPHELFICICRRTDVPLEEIEHIKRWYVTPEMLSLETTIEHRYHLDIK